MDKNEAIKAINTGAIVAIISAALTLIVVLASIATDADGTLSLWNDPLNLLDVVIILLFAYGVYRKSRVAAVLLVIYFIIGKIIIAVNLQRAIPMMIIVSLIFLFYYIRSAYGTFVYHRLEKLENPDYRATSKWTYIIGIPSTLVFLLILGLALFSTTGVLPSPKVKASQEIFSHERDALVLAGILAKDEKIDYFYSQGTSSILESGNILTKERVILYITEPKKGLQIYAIALNEVTEVILESKGNSVHDSVYVVRTNDPDRWLKLFLSTMQKGDEKFVSALRGKLYRYD